MPVTSYRSIAKKALRAIEAWQHDYTNEMRRAGLEPPSFRRPHMAEISVADQS